MATSGNYSKGGFRVAFTAGGTTAGDMAAVLNPTGEALVITKTIVNITTASTGASTLDIGIAANGTTSNDTLIDGLSGATAGVFSTPGTNGLPTKLWGATEYLTVSEASGDVTGIVGEVILQFLTR
jgi:hypothetical protein